jgi:U32 family peptidase
MVVKIVELLSPAKDMASLNSAISNGADSVYVGLKGYNMRANVANFSIDQISDAVKLCHTRGVKLYLCINTMLKDRDIHDLKHTMHLIKASGADAVIVSDNGAVKIARENDVDIHMSVQSNITNSESLKVLEDMGVTRIILSRELSLDEIKQIAANTKVEVEVFVHGAMCVAVSGRCFLSSYLYNKSANCGECLQPCRKEWKIVSEDNEEFILENKLMDNLFADNEAETENGFNKNHSSHILSPRDLCMVEHIPELVDAGVSVFKIEGRARPSDYVASVTKVYREAIDDYEEGNWDSDKQNGRIEGWLNELGEVFNRGFDSGFFLKTPFETSCDNISKYKKKDIGEVVNYYQKVCAAELKIWDDIMIGDKLTIQGSTTGSINLTVESMQINGKNINKAVKGTNVAISLSEKVRPKDNVYKRILR